MKTSRLALVVGAVTAVAVFAAAAVAFGGVLGRNTPLAGERAGMMFVADQDEAGGATMWGCAGPAALQDPQAREDLQALREEHRAEMDAWWQEYGDDPGSEAARKALDELRSEHRADMVDLFEKYGVTPPARLGTGGGCGLGGATGAGCPGPGLGGPGRGGNGYGAGMMGGVGMMGRGSSWSAGAL